MSIELFLVPMFGDGTQGDPYRAKYQTGDDSIMRAGHIRYGHTDSAVLMLDAAPGYLNFVGAQVDATSLATPANIDDVLTAGQASAAKTIFENLGIPGEHINAGDTRRAAIRSVIGMFLFSQRMEGRFGESFRQRAIAHGVTLNTEFNAFPQALKDAFIAIRDDHGWGNLGLTNQSTLRQILMAVADGFEDEPMTIAGVTI